MYDGEQLSDPVFDGEEFSDPAFDSEELMYFKSSANALFLL